MDGDKRGVPPGNPLALATLPKDHYLPVGPKVVTPKAKVPKKAKNDPKSTTTSSIPNGTKDSKNEVKPVELEAPLLPTNDE